MPTDKETIRRRLRVKTRSEGDCEVWVGHTKEGYGQITIDGMKKRVHRLTWEIERGPIPEGMGVLHTCDNRACRKLSHLFLGDAVSNNLDRDAKGRGSAGRRERHGHAKLTEAEVAAIKQDPAKAAILAFTHGVSVETIRRIRRGEAWGTTEQAEANRLRRRREREITRENNRRKAVGLPPQPRESYGANALPAFREKTTLTLPGKPPLTVSAGSGMSVSNLQEVE